MKKYTSPVLSRRALFAATFVVAALSAPFANAKDETHTETAQHGASIDDDYMHEEITYDQTALTGSITISPTVNTTDNTGYYSSDKDSSLKVGTDQTAATDIIIRSNDENGTLAVRNCSLNVTVGGDQTAISGCILIQTDLVTATIDTVSYSDYIRTNNTVGTAGSTTSTQQAGADITINGASNTVYGDQVAGGSISVTKVWAASQGGSTGRNTIDGDQIANTNISLSNGTNTVGGMQVAENGYISIDNTTNTVGGNQIAGSNISITGESKVTIAGSQSTLTEGISVSGSKATLTVTKNQTAKTDITISEGATVTIDENGAVYSQTAETGNIKVDNATLTIGASGNTVSDQTAGKDIDISDSTVRVYGDQTAGGQIYVHDDTANTTTLTVAGAQRAGTSISFDQIKSATISGGQSAGTSIDFNQVGKVDITGDQVAGDSITIDSSSLSLKNGANQIATNGSIEIDSSSFEISGNQIAGTNIVLSNNKSVDASQYRIITGYQKAGGDIEITNSHLFIGKGQTAGGNITVSDSNTWVYVYANQQAGGDITLEDGATLQITGSQTSENGQITVNGSSALTVSGDQLAKTRLSIDGSSVDVEGNQTVESGGIAVNTNSTLNVGKTQKASGDIYISKSIVAIGDVETGDQISENGNITIYGARNDTDKTAVSVSGNQTAANGEIEITNTAEVTVSGDQIAQSIYLTGEQKDGTGSYYYRPTLVVSENQTATSAIIVIGAAKLEAWNQTAGKNIRIFDSTEGTITRNQTAGTGIDIRGTGSASAAFTVGGDQTAGEQIYIFGSNVTVGGNQTAGTFIHIGDLTVGTLFNWVTEDKYSTVSVEGNMSAGVGEYILIEGQSTVTVGGTLSTKLGTLTVGSEDATADKHASLTIGETSTDDSVIDSDIATITVNPYCTLETKNKVNLTNVALSLGTGSTLTTTIWTSNGTHNIIGKAGTGDDDTSTHAKVNSSDALTLTGSTKLIYADITSADDIRITGGIDANYASITAGGTLVIESTSGNDHAIGNSTLSSQNAGIGLIGASASEKLSFQAGKIEASGSTGVSLENVYLSDSRVVATAGDINLSGSVHVLRSVLFCGNASIKSVPDPVASNEITSVHLSNNATVTLDNLSILNGKLSSNSENASIIKIGGDVLKLDYTARGYYGSINVTNDDGSEFVINCDGLSNAATTILKDTNLLITKEAFAESSDKTVQLGSIDTSADTGVRSAEQLAKRLVDEISYTGDKGTRASFQDVGTMIFLGEGSVGDNATGRNMTLSSHTLLKMEQSLNNDGTITADKITLDGTLDARGARLFASIITSADSIVDPSTIADQTRVRVIDAASVTSAFDEDLLYDIVYDEKTLTYQRNLKTLNAHVETTADGVDVVYSKNYISAEGKTDTQQGVANTLSSISDTKNHTEGTLATSTDALDNLLAAFDYTRSAGDSLAALKSVGGTTNTLAQLAIVDSSDHHIDMLRSRIALPAREYMTDEDGEKQLLAGSNSSLWASYTGGYDTLGGNSDMGDYSRSYQGFLVGGGFQLNENWLVGISLGYENSIARSESAKFDADTNFVDFYVSARTGDFNHRLSLGFADHDFDAKRSVYVAAGTHSFGGEARGSTDAFSFNLGYEISMDFELTESTGLTPFVTLNYASHKVDTLTEEGLGTAGLETNYDDMNYINLGLGARVSQSFALFSELRPAFASLSLAVRADLCDREAEASSNFVGEPSKSFGITAPERDPLYAQIALGVSVPFAENWSAAAGVSADLGQDRSSVFGSLSLSYDF